VLVDFPATIPASDSVVYHLVDGSGQPAGSLATDNGTYFTINTGILQATIRKSPNNILDQVVVGGVTYISAGNAGGLKLMVGSETWTPTTSKPTPIRASGSR
jgi:hypothetical protein